MQRRTVRFTGTTLAGMQINETEDTYHDGKPVLDREKAFPELLLCRQQQQASTKRVTRRTSMIGNIARTTVVGLGLAEEEDENIDENTVILTDSQSLATSGWTTKYASFAMLFCVLAEGIQEMSVMPNYPLMVTPNAHPESFTTTYPFGITAAQYVLCAATAIATMVSNLVSGRFADRYGQRKMVLVLTSGTIICNIVKFFVRHSFWAFVAMCFLNGLFTGNVAVANSYISLIYSDNRQMADKMISYVTATSIASFSIGGLLTILFPDNLFVPLLVAAGISFIAALAAFAFVLDPGSYQKQREHEDQDDKEDSELPKVLDKKLFFNILCGALMDNIGSLGITRKSIQVYSLYAFLCDIHLYI